MRSKLVTDTRPAQRGRAVLQALAEVVYEAQKRGLSLLEAYVHFDKRGEGVVSVDDLMRAVIELRLSPSADLWDEQDAEECVAILSRGKSRAYFSRENFVCYFSSAASILSRATRERTTTQSKVAPFKSPKRQFNLHTTSLQKGNDLQERQEQHAAVSHTMASSMTQRKTKLRVTLPEWAHVRSKRALKELEARRQARSKPLSLSSAQTLLTATSLPEPPIDTHHSVNETIHDHDNNEPDAMEKQESSSDILAFPLSDRWQTFQVDTDTIISYGIISHDTLPSSSSISPMKTDSKAGDKTAEKTPSGLPNMTAFRLTVFLDAFQCLETLEAFFQPLLVHFPRGKILLCGFPTRSKRNITWHSARFASVYCQLLEHVMVRSREWLVQPKLGVGAVAQYLVGFGTGGSAALHLLGMELPMRQSKENGGGALGLFARSLRGLMLINALASITEAESKTLRTLQELLHANIIDQLGVSTNVGAAVELHEALTSTLFSEHYLTQVAPSRSVALEAFFRTRRDFLKAFRPSTACDGNVRTGQLLQVLLRGARKNRDTIAAITNLAAVIPAPFALIVAHGSQNALFTPHQVKLITGDNNALSLAGFTQAKTVMESLALNPVSSTADSALGSDAHTLHVAWLKGGHEILQERNAFFYDLFRQLVTAAVTRPESRNTSGKHFQNNLTSDEHSHSNTSQEHRHGMVATAPQHPKSNNDQDEVLPIEQKPDERSSVVQPESSENHSKIHERVVEHLSTYGLPWIQQELYDHGIEGAGPTNVILEHYERLLVQEEDLARRKERDKQRMHNKHDEFYNQRRIHDQEAKERKQQAADARRSIQRRERESQRRFFEQMEAIKLENARLLLENDSMKLEDCRSRKLNNIFINDLRRCEQERIIVQQMSELEAERQEQIQHESQVKLQAVHLEEQKAQREALKAIQQEFELKELVSSPIESYCLDAPATSDFFHDISRGSHALATDLAHFYEMKVLQARESLGKRLELEALQCGPLAAQELKVRNLERVQVKAQKTGMIAKAGMGNVRMVPITKAEMQALGEEMHVARDDLERMRNDAALRQKELGWKDRLLQHVNVIIQRNERFRENVIAKLMVCVDIANERVLTLREDSETLEVKCSELSKLREELKDRQVAVQSECERARASTTAFFDTNLRVVGAYQRVQRTVFIKELEAENESLTIRMTALDDQENAAHQELIKCRTISEEVATQILMLEESQQKLRGVNEAEDVGNDSSSKDVLPSRKMREATYGKVQENLAESVRMKKHIDRSPEEKQWVALDFLVNFAHYYKHVAPKEVEIIQLNKDYEQKSEKKLTIEHIQRLMQLPARNCLAFAFFKSLEEMEAHCLLRKYTFGDGEEYFARLDREFEDQSTIAAPCAVLSSSLKSMHSTLEQVADSMPLDARRCSRARAALLDDNLTPSTLLHVPQTQILPHTSTTHSFQLHDTSTGIAVLAFTVSITFQGHFNTTGYQNGRLAAMIYMLPPVTDSTSLQQKYQAPIPIGKCFYAEDLALCSPHSMGKLVLRHEPLSIPLSNAMTYQIVLGAPVLTSYTLEVRGRTALFADEALRRKRIDALKKQDLLPRKQDELQNIFLTIQLSERKKRLARRLATEAKDEACTAELELLKHNQKLEQDNVELLLSHQERRDLHAAIQVASKTFTHCSFLFSKREEEVRDIEKSLKELTRLHVDIIDDCKNMERLLADYRTNLPPIACLLVEDQNSELGDVAAAKLAKELNVEYVSKNGTKSAKARWVELSVMKAKLPSMMTPAERLRRKYKKGQDTLDKKERAWVLLDRILHPRLYQWEKDKHKEASDGEYTTASSVKLQFFGPYPKLSKDEKQLALLSQTELDRIKRTPWNLLERKDLLIRKMLTQFRDDNESNAKRYVNPHEPAMSTVALLRAQPLTELNQEERECRLYDQVLNPHYYPVSFKRLAQEMTDDMSTSGQLEQVATSSKITRRNLIMTILTPEEELYKLSSDLLRARTLLLKYDPQLITNLSSNTSIQQQSQDLQVSANTTEVDVDARCRLVFQELQRAIANTRNEFMDSHVLHSTLQRFPTNVLRLELEKELDRLLISQIKEKEDFELIQFFAKKEAFSITRDSLSDSDSDDEAIIARELEVRRKVKTNGKPVKRANLQKQRREVKNLLLGRSLEQQRLILKEQELGPGGCTACWTNPCQWKPYLMESSKNIQERIDSIHEELERVKHCTDSIISSNVCKTAVQSGSRTIVLRKSDLVDELSLELKTWEKNLRLKAVDEELHETFCTKKEVFETRALHGFQQIQHTDKVQIALHREHNALIADLAAYEVLEDVLESMLEGWVFGERRSERQELGYVPSLKREGPLTLHDVCRLEQNRRIRQARQDRNEEQLSDAQNLPSDKWQPIEVMPFQVNRAKKAVQKGSELDKSLTETENALKFGLFCMTLMYFRGLSLLKKQKSVWSISATKWRAGGELSKSGERRQMDNERRNVELRARKAAFYDGKARVGQARRQKFHEQKSAAYRKRLMDENRKAKREKTAAIDIQRIYRGHIGKIAGKRWMLRRREINAQRALDYVAAITLQRAYRGRLGRIAAEDKRIELAEFISQIRAEEAINEEKEYWQKHKIERMARRIAVFVKKEA